LVLDLTEQQMRGIDWEVSLLFGAKPSGEFLSRFKETGASCVFACLRSGYDISPAKMFRIYRVLVEQDIIHIHSFNPIIAFCAILSRKKLVFTDHGNYGEGAQPTMFRSLKSILLGVFLRNSVDYLSFNSQYTRMRDTEFHRLYKVRASVIYNGICFGSRENRLERIEKIIAERINHKFVVGTASRFAAFKRIDRLIEAFANFQDSKDTLLMIVGDGPFRLKYEKQISQLGIESKCIVTGFRENVRIYQRAFHVCVCPSKGEPFGLAAVESLSIGTPTIVYHDGGGIVEVLGAGFQDDVVATESELVERLNYYYRSSNDIAIRADERKKRARKFDIVKMADRFYNAYLEMLSGPGRGS